MQLVGIKRDRDALNVLYAHRQSHARTHASRRPKREEERRREKERERQRAVKKPLSRGEGISRKEGQREGEKREWEKKREMSTLVYLEATSGRRRPRATHGGNPYTRVRPRRQLTRAHAHTHARPMYGLYAHSTREPRAAITLVWRRSRARVREGERGQIESRTEWGKRRVCGATRIRNTSASVRTCTRRIRARHRPGTARAKLTLT